MNAINVGGDDALAKVQVVAVRLERAEVSQRTVDVHDGDGLACETKRSEGSAT